LAVIKVISIATINGNILAHHENYENEN